MEQKLNELYGKIAENLNKTIPENWDKVIMYGEVSEGASEVFFNYYPVGSKESVYSHNIPDLFNVSEDEYRELLLQLINNLEELQDIFIQNGQEPWTNLTFILESNGKFKIDYDYTDLSEASPRKQHWIWNYKYLGIMPENEKGKKVVEEYIKSLV
jgi:uncharacterized protein (TIGR01741 family)